MPLQNRVDPFGAIHAAPARGRFTGNRGVIHDPATRTLLRRRWTTKAWIICACDYKGWKREPMGRNAPGGGAGWTELFFLDEVTALAAGHRPCFTCRRPAARAFASAFASGQCRDRVSAPDMDVVLHGERFACTPSAPRPICADPSALADGAMLFAGDRAFAIRHGRLLPWSFDGYGPPVPTGAALNAEPLRLLTPPAALAALAAGYAAVWHETAQNST
ncbi:hypothetical protein EJC49_16645 [Aquibium carbonis]|uniref:Uncharacterized protein n=1 Tax=Aquibium carbonis TaxID=2495581 RepID=A0A429YUY1_9HYPH|nr:hypothetical protein [Aquibium carbonis]RST85261.1 hypothetical protein EJC49_16645 [Aquibium carbonis]